MSIVINCELPYPPYELSPNKRLHFAKKAKIAADYRLAVYVYVAKNMIKKGDKSKRYELILNIRPHNKLADDDNIEAAFKAGRDAMCEALGINDRQIKSSKRVMFSHVKGGNLHVILREIDANSDKCFGCVYSGDSSHCGSFC